MPSSLKDDAQLKKNNALCDDHTNLRSMRASPLALESHSGSLQFIGIFQNFQGSKQCLFEYKHKDLFLFLNY